MSTAVSYPSSLSRAAWREPSVLPGFGPALGFTLFYLSVVVLVPLAALVLRPWELGLQGFFSAVTAPRVLAALRLSFGGAALAASINAFFGLIVAWVMVRYEFPFKRFVDALIDLPFALPTAVAGIALAALYGPKGWIGGLLAQLGMKVAYTPAGIIVAMTFIVLMSTAAVVSDPVLAT